MNKPANYILFASLMASLPAVSASRPTVLSNEFGAGTSVTVSAVTHLYRDAPAVSWKVTDNQQTLVAPSEPSQTLGTLTVTAAGSLGQAKNVCYKSTDWMLKDESGTSKVADVTLITEETTNDSISDGTCFGTAGNKAFTWQMQSPRASVSHGVYNVQGVITIFYE